jgi:dienelactone hydrolase
MGVIVEDLPYECEGARLRGVVAYDDTIAVPRPAVLIIHAAWGPGRYERERAVALAEMGFVALVADLYGVDAPELTTNDDAVAYAKQVMGLLDDGYVKRIHAGLDTLRSHPLTDPARLAAMGYCMGGSAVLDLARRGADVAGVISFHGGLRKLPNLPVVTPIKPRILLLHGWDDPYAPAEHVAMIAEELTAAQADWQLHAYGNTGHAFANPYKDYGMTGVGHQPDAARRSWIALTEFLSELFTAS